MITINGVELKFSYSNPQDLKRYEAARKTVAEKYANIPTVEDGQVTEEQYIQTLTTGIKAFAAFFDELFGKGTSNRLFGKETDFETVVDAYTEFVNGVQAQAARLTNKLAAFVPDDAQR